MKTIFEFDDNNPSYYENRENTKLYAMQNAEMLGFSLQQMFDKTRQWEKNDKYIISTDEVRNALLEILDNNGINLERLGY